MQHTGAAAAGCACATPRTHVQQLGSHAVDLAPQNAVELLHICTVLMRTCLCACHSRCCGACELAAGSACAAVLAICCSCCCCCFWCLWPTSQGCRRCQRSRSQPLLFSSQQAVLGQLHARLRVRRGSKHVRHQACGASKCTSPVLFQALTIMHAQRSRNCSSWTCVHTLHSLRVSALLTGWQASRLLLLLLSPSASVLKKSFMAERSLGCGSGLHARWRCQAARAAACCAAALRACCSSASSCSTSGLQQQDRQWP